MAVFDTFPRARVVAVLIRVCLVMLFPDCPAPFKVFAGGYQPLLKLHNTQFINVSNPPPGYHHC